MPVESCLMPEETPALAVQATALIDAAMSRLTPEARAAFWASVRKCYNTPYNDPKPRALPGRPAAELQATPETVRIERAQPDMSQREAGRISMPMAAISGASPFVDAHTS